MEFYARLYLQDILDSSQSPSSFDRVNAKYISKKFKIDPKVVLKDICDMRKGNYP